PQVWRLRVHPLGVWVRERNKGRPNRDRRRAVAAAPPGPTYPSKGCFRASKLRHRPAELGRQFQFAAFECSRWAALLRCSAHRRAGAKSTTYRSTATPSAARTPWPSGSTRDRRQERQRVELFIAEEYKLDRAASVRPRNSWPETLCGPAHRLCAGAQ